MKQARALPDLTVFWVVFLALLRNRKRVSWWEEKLLPSACVCESLVLNEGCWDVCHQEVRGMVASEAHEWTMQPTSLLSKTTFWAARCPSPCQYRIKTLHVIQIPQRADKHGAGRPGFKNTFIFVVLSSHQDTAKFKTHLCHPRHDGFKLSHRNATFFFFLLWKNKLQKIISLLLGLFSNCRAL